MRRLFLSLAIVSTLGACGADPVWAPDADVAAARYVSEAPPSVTLFTVLRVNGDSGAHSGLMINGSQRVMFDPAGTWHHPRLPERNDVHFGITDKMVNFYIDYHARETYYVVEQTLPVSPQVADLVMQRALSHGAVAKAMCSNSVTDVLRGVPGFEAIPATWFPRNLMKAFGELPGVTSRTITDDDADDNHGVLMVQMGDPRAQ
ncbi:hypothetical protein [Rhodobacter ferrooxidans]|uniref:Lipoprotein n=1 Tax=Rhodobacter ferrooxidans TaxID=371731 RepID=C8S2F5_9RHOB|nr:hypothetical protein [Rhodobacter sp. SW2]EEW24826.1 conserved hypothetical protein [Rhodobacter sp. SW2]